MAGVCCWWLFLGSLWLVFGVGLFLVCLLWLVGFVTLFGFLFVCLLCIGKAILYFVVFVWGVCCMDYDDFDDVSDFTKPLDLHIKYYPRLSDGDDLVGVGGIVGVTFFSGSLRFTIYNPAFDFGVAMGRAGDLSGRRNAGKNVRDVLALLAKDRVDDHAEIIKLIYDEYREFIEDPVNVSQDIQKVNRDFSSEVLMTQVVYGDGVVVDVFLLDRAWGGVHPVLVRRLEQLVGGASMESVVGGGVCLSESGFDYGDVDDGGSEFFDCDVGLFIKAEVAFEVRGAGEYQGNVVGCRVLEAFLSRDVEAGERVALPLDLASALLANYSPAEDMEPTFDSQWEVDVNDWWMGGSFESYVRDDGVRASNSVLALSTTVSILKKADSVYLADGTEQNALYGFDPNGEVADTMFDFPLDHAEPLRPLILGLLGFDVQEESIASIADSISE